MTLSRDRYVKALGADGRRLAEVARRGLDADVPTCPGWVVRDVVAHTGVVHRHKEQIVREQLLTPPDKPTAAEDDELIDWYLEGLDRLVETLVTADPAAQMYTFYRRDRTAGFWQRRMCHETAIHRVDVELAHDEATPIDAAIAADGVDEVLGASRAAVDRNDPFEPDGRTVIIRSADTGDTWHLVLGTAERRLAWRWAPGGTDDPETVITATADVLDRWVWGRIDPGFLAVDGDTTIPETIRKVVAGLT